MKASVGILVLLTIAGLFVPPATGQEDRVQLHMQSARGKVLLAQAQQQAPLQWAQQQYQQPYWTGPNQSNGAPQYIAPQNAPPQSPVMEAPPAQAPYGPNAQPVSAPTYGPMNAQPVQYNGMVPFAPAGGQTYAAPTPYGTANGPSQPYAASNAPLPQYVNQAGGTGAGLAPGISSSPTLVQPLGTPYMPTPNSVPSLNGIPAANGMPTAQNERMNQAVGGMVNAAAGMANAAAGMVNAAAGVVNAAAAKFNENNPGAASNGLPGMNSLPAAVPCSNGAVVPLFTPLNQPAAISPAVQPPANPMAILDSLIPKKKYLARHTGGTEDDRMWPMNHLNLKVYIKPGDGIPRYKPSFYQRVQTAFQEWQTALNGVVTFSFVDAPEGSDVQVEFIEYCRHIGHDTADGVTLLYYDKAGFINTAHVYLATTMPDLYLQGKQDNHTIHATALHELGHVLGLAHSPNNNDIMYFKNHSRQRVMVEGILPLNFSMPTGLSKTDVNRALQIYTSNQ